MNLFQLVFKQMRQRALSTWLTLLSVALGVGLAIAIMVLQREGKAIFGQTDYGYDVLVGAKGSPLQLTLNTIYQIDRSPGNIPYSLYDAMIDGEYQPHVKQAIPYAVGDTFQNHRIVGTIPRLFGIDDDGNRIAEPFQYRPEKHYELADGSVFHPRKFQAVIGADVPARTGLKIGDTFKATHGMPAPNQSIDEHDTQWEVVGILEPTHTAADRVLFIPLLTFYAVAEHGHALEAIAEVKHGHESAVHEHEHDESFTLNADGTLDLHLPKDQWQVSAILVDSRSPFDAQQLMYVINNRNEAAAVNPASVMREFFGNFLDNGARVLLAISLLVTLVAAASILTTIYNSISARRRDIAILRALGATRNRILALVCLEAGLIGLLGGTAGIILGHLLAAAGSVLMDKLMGEGINWLSLSGYEVLFLLFVVGLATAAGLVPGLKAYSTPVATHLTSV